LDPARKKLVEWEGAHMDSTNPSRHQGAKSQMKDSICASVMPAPWTSRNDVGGYLDEFMPEELDMYGVCIIYIYVCVCVRVGIYLLIYLFS
jgi:hypothetical protein